MPLLIVFTVYIAVLTHNAFQWAGQPPKYSIFLLVKYKSKVYVSLFSTLL